MSKEIVRYHIRRAQALELLLGDITQEQTDAIVNAANSGLLGGGGVDGAIHRAAGPKLLAECRKIREQSGALPPGEAVATRAGDLQIKYVIHTVGPVWHRDDAEEATILESCYRRSLREAGRLSCSSISFPSVSTGAFGYPVESAAKIALRTVVAELPNTPSVRLARFVLFDHRTRDAYMYAALKLSTTSSDLEIYQP